MKEKSMNKEYSLLIFDLDGTLTNSEEGIINSVSFALDQLKITGYSRDDLLKFIGPPLLDSFCQFMTLDKTQGEKAIALYRQYFTTKGIYQNSLYPGMKNLLANLKTQGYRLCVGTSKPTPFAKRILDHFDISHYFEYIMGSNLDNTKTDKAEIISSIMEHFPEITHSKMLMIGDRCFDIQGARDVGIDSMAVLYGFGDEAEFDTYPPTLKARTVKELGAILMNNDEGR